MLWSLLLVLAAECDCEAGASSAGFVCTYGSHVHHGTPHPERYLLSLMVKRLNHHVPYVANVVMFGVYRVPHVHLTHVGKE